MASQDDLFLNSYEKDKEYFKTESERSRRTVSVKASAYPEKQLSTLKKGTLNMDKYRYICTVHQVKPYSGYYHACLNCKRKLRALEPATHVLTSAMGESTKYRCSKCCVNFTEEELGFCYCLILTVTDHHHPTTGTKVVSLFGRNLEGIFGLQAKQMHRYLNGLGDETVPAYELLVKTLETLLIGACVELTFHATSCAIHCGEIGERRHQVATGIKLLGSSRNETVFSLLSAHEATPAASLSAPTAVASGSGRMMSQQNCSTDLDSSSFLYDTKSQATSTHTTFDRKSFLPLKLESFLHDTQSQRNSLDNDLSRNLTFTVDEFLDVETSEDIVHELESEWENTQQMLELHQKPVLGVNVDLASSPGLFTCYEGDPGFEDNDELAFSEEVVNELQETFDNSMEPSISQSLANNTFASLPAPTATVTPLSNFTGTDFNIRGFPPTSGLCCGTPELFSSHKKLNHRGVTARLMMGENVTSSSFTPELFGATPLVVRESPSSISSTPSILSGRSHLPIKRSLLQDSTVTPLGHCVSHSITAASSQLQLDNSTYDGQEHSVGFYTPLSQNEHSQAFGCTISSPDLFL